MAEEKKSFKVLEILKENTHLKGCYSPSESR